MPDRAVARFLNAVKFSNGRPLDGAAPMFPPERLGGAARTFGADLKIPNTWRGPPRLRALTSQPARR